MVRFSLSSKTTAIRISLWIGYTVLETKRKKNSRCFGLATKRMEFLQQRQGSCGWSRLENHGSG